jgi:hypothetical protein
MIGAVAIDNDSNYQQQSILNATYLHTTQQLTWLLAINIDDDKQQQ